MSALPTIPDGKKEACKTYLEQTKLLVTLASAFLFAPAGLVTIMKDKASARLTYVQIGWFIAAEVCFIFSVLAGYVVLGSLAGSQDDDSFNVFRTATRLFSLLQFGAYVVGLVLFIALAVTLVT